MKLTCVLNIMLLALSTEACKGKPKRLEPVVIHTTTVTTPISTEVTEIITQEIPTIKAKNFAVLFYNNKTKEYATGIRILPNMILTSNLIKEIDAMHFTIILLAAEFGDQPYATKINRVHEFTESEITFALVENKRSWSSGLENDMYDTIPINTRLEALTDDCQIYTMGLNYVIEQHDVHLLPKSKCNGTRICAGSKSKICFEPSGSALVCNFRLVGIRADTSKCNTEPFSFSNMAYFDGLILKTVNPHGYLIDFDIIRYNCSPPLSKSVLFVTICLCLYLVK